MLLAHRAVHKCTQGSKQLQSTGDNDVDSSSSLVFLNRSNRSMTRRCAIESDPHTFNRISWGYIQRKMLHFLYTFLFQLTNFASLCFSWQFWLFWFFFLWRFMMKLPWLKAGTLILFFSFFLKLCSSEAIFPTLTIFFPVECSPSMHVLYHKWSSWLHDTKQS